MRVFLLLAILGLLTLGAHEPKTPVGDPAAPPQKGYRLTVQFGKGQDAPILKPDLNLGFPFGASNGMGFRVLAIGGQIEVPQGGKFHGLLTLVDYSVSKDGVGGTGGTCTTQLDLELGKPYAFEAFGGRRSYTVTLTKKPAQ